MTKKKEKVEEIFKKMKSIKVCFLSSIIDDLISARPMTIMFKEDDIKNIYFISDSHAEQVSQFTNNKNSLVTITDNIENTYIELKGHVTLTESKEKIKPFWNAFVDVWFPEGLEKSEVTLIKFKIDHIECWDSTGSTIFKVANMIKAKVLNQQPDLGEKTSISMN